MRERILNGFSLSERTTSSVKLDNAEGFAYTLELLASSIVRIRLTSSTHPSPLHDNVIWRAEPVPWDDVQINEQTVKLNARGLSISLDMNFLCMRATKMGKGGPQNVYSDLPHRTFAATPTGIVHYSRVFGPPQAGECLHLGLGEKGAPLDLNNRRFAMRGTDAANYDAYYSDPLYKHTPWLVTLKKGGGWAVGLYNASNSDGTWKVGSEVDDPWNRYKSYEQDVGGLEEYIIFGDTAQEVVEDFARLVGYPILPSRHWLGYLASSMGYAESDDPPAQQLLMKFPELCAQHDIPCSAMHLSSGYTVAMTSPKHRQVFTLNTERYPDFAGLFRHYHSQGIRVAPNIKPFVLRTHPAFKQLLEGGAFFKDSSDKLAETRIWSALPGENASGAWLDMSSKAGRDWWYSGVSGLVKAGADAMWNDNNEFSLHDDDYICAWEADGIPGQGKQPVGFVGRMFHTQLMGRTSFEALRDADPARRPFIVTRSANVGTMRWVASTWSGDNWTSWRTLKGNVSTALNAGISLMHSYGHDVGGFAGPLPSPELFLRWVQSCGWNPRFCIHSFKPTAMNKTGSTTVNEPWMHPEVTPLIRKAIKRRYELIPYIYALHWESHTKAKPLNTWLGWDEFESDPAVYDERVIEGQDFWLGTGRILVAGVYEAGQTSRTVYLPNGKRDLGYYDLNAPYSYHPAGSWVTVDTPLAHIATFARVGSVIPIGKPRVTVTSLEGPSRTAIDGVSAVLDRDGGRVSLDDWRGVEIFPPPQSTPGEGRTADNSSSSSAAVEDEFSFEWTEDDGEAYTPTTTIVRVSFKTSGQSILVDAAFVKRDFDVLWGSTLRVVLPAGDQRSVAGTSGSHTEDGRPCFEIAVKPVKT